MDDDITQRIQKELYNCAVANSDFQVLRKYWDKFAPEQKDNMKVRLQGVIEACRSQLDALSREIAGLSEANSSPAETK